MGGPKGNLQLKFKYIVILVKNETITINPLYKNTKKYKRYHGLYRSLINNMIIGVSHGFKKILIIEGVGFRASLIDNMLALSIGFSNIIYKKIPNNLSVNISNQNKKIIIEGNDKINVGLFAAMIRKLKPPECYL